MTKHFLRFCAALLSGIFIIGCAGSPISKPVSSQVSSPASSIDSNLGCVSGSAVSGSVSGSVSAYISQWGSHAPVPVESDPGYFIFIDELLLGSYHDGQWYSIKDRDLSVADLLKQEAYYCYDQTDLIGISKKLSLFYFFDFGCSFKDDPQPLFPYAAENDTKNENITFHLPCAIPQDLHYIRYETYNKNVDFKVQYNENDRISLILSANFNPLPKTEIKKLAEPYSEADKAAEKAELEKLGIPGAPVNITECYDFDYNGDGITEHFIIANTPRGEDGYAYISPEEYKNDQSGYYYIVLCKSQTGYKTVASWCWPYLFSKRACNIPDCTAIQSVQLKGMFDLNNDGTFEICLYDYEWEGYGIHVYSLNQQDQWEQVLSGSGGM